MSEPIKETLSFVISLLLGGAAVMLVSRLLSNFQITGGFKTSLWVAVIYGLLKALLGKALFYLSLPFIVVTLGFFLLVINAFLLWLTDLLIKRFEVKTKGALLGGALLLSIFDLAFQLVLRGGAVF
jgi:putative membrane protein